MPPALPIALPVPLSESLPASLREQLQTARELGRRSSEAASQPPFATSVEALDRLLEGGLPRGRLVELIGRKTCGRFSIVLSTLASATGAAETTALVDLGDSFDPQAAEIAGTALERLLWVRPRRLKEALISAEMLLGTGFPLVILDLGHPPVPGGRGVEAFWLRLARAAAARGAALLVSSPYRVSGTAAAAVVKAMDARPIWRGGEYGRGCSSRLLMGCRSSLILEKINGQGTSRPAEPLRLLVGAGLAPARRRTGVRRGAEERGRLEVMGHAPAGAKSAQGPSDRATAATRDAGVLEYVEEPTSEGRLEVMGHAPAGAKSAQGPSDRATAATRDAGVLEYVEEPRSEDGSR